MGVEVLELWREGSMRATPRVVGKRQRTVEPVVDLIRTSLNEEQHLVAIVWGQRGTLRALFGVDVRLGSGEAAQRCNGRLRAGYICVD